jgi:hypothetical protein
MNTTKKPQAHQSMTKNAPKGKTRGDSNGPREEHKATMGPHPVTQPKKNATPTTVKSQQQCKSFFLKGTCKFGARCFYSHSMPKTQLIKKNEPAASVKVALP